MADRGEVSIIFPTRRNLERLAQADNFLSSSVHAAAHPVELVTPWIETRGGETHLCIPSHLGYPVTSEPFERRSEEHTSDLQSIMRISYAVFSSQKKHVNNIYNN